jgi:hypothetical protein
MASSDLSPFRSIEASLKVALAPCQIEHPIQAIQEQINNLLFRYNESLQGVPLTYNNLHFENDTKCGRILDELAWIHVDIVATLLVFQPYKGQVLLGCINKVY